MSMLFNEQMTINLIIIIIICVDVPSRSIRGVGKMIRRSVFYGLPKKEFIRPMRWII